MDYNIVIGEKVLHQESSLGAGVIQKIIRDPYGIYYIHVQFEHTGEIKRFEFPKIISKLKLLSTESDIILSVITDISGQHQCDVCEMQCKKITNVDNQKVCDECIKTFVKCADCKRVFNPQKAGIVFENEWWREKKAYICEECATMNYRKCLTCGKMFTIKGRLESYPAIPEGIELCDYCLEEASVICHCCDNYILPEQSVKIEGHNVCPECRKTNAFICLVCGKAAIRDSIQKATNALCFDCESKQLYENYVTEKIERLNLAETISFYRFKNLRTTKIMSRLRRSYGETPKDAKDSPIDALLISFSEFSLVVVYGLPNRIGNIYNGSCTMTNFKQTNSFKWYAINTSRADKTLTVGEGRVFTMWNEPFNLRAVTDSDKDFRKEYNNGDLVYEGSNYGDTSNFYIIGSITEGPFN